ncbi:hypothetical protein ABEF92_006594 [Exophiala dermatitidis]|uniref:Uncharacterized protein n=1 Tax=Exophiala dermatitidis (strain ATCC 34100 / CBS 525.76 / NIH/UT8656) TaxID=858893 RepID=H6C0I0_EXODN|nr:uncharacterized protein HMPREF1120_04490 [Exophiala dermatitidis NIH/UT8656]EHY56408.1 hypothetical protein HMPREF1120_04490 [Exophiala dermatitidis NIH/UT8656]
MESFSLQYDMSELALPIRLGLVVNDIVAMSLSFATERTLFLVLGGILATSLLFNGILTVAGLWQKRSRSRLRLADEPHCPSLIVLTIEVLGVIAFLVLFVMGTVDATNDYYYYYGQELTMKNYACIGSIVACSLEDVMFSLPPSPPEQERDAAGQRAILSPNADGEGENDRLVATKE